MAADNSRQLLPVWAGSRPACVEQEIDAEDDSDLSSDEEGGDAEEEGGMAAVTVFDCIF